MMREASLQDLLDAWEGFSAFHGINAKNNISALFLADMMQRFPDKKEKTDDDQKTL